MESNEFSDTLNEKEFLPKNNSKTKYLVIIFSIIALLIIAGIILLIYFGSKNTKGGNEDENENNNKTYIGEIICTYNIEKENTEIKIFGDKFENITKFDLLLDNNKNISFQKEYLFDKKGEHTIKIILYEKINMDYMFTNIDNLISIELKNNEENNANDKITSMISTFENCINLKNFKNIHLLENSKISSMQKAFKNTGLREINLSLDISYITDMTYLFASSPLLESIVLSNSNKYGFNNNESLINISYIFSNCSSLSNIDLSSFDSSHVIDMSHSFENCIYLGELDLSKLNTSLVKDMSYMFFSCSFLYNLIINFNTKNVVYMNNMFDGCENLIEINSASFDTSQVLNMSCLFKNCQSLMKISLQNFNTKKVKDMSYMFYYNPSLNILEIKNFDTSQVTNMSYMFGGCIELTSIQFGKDFITNNVIDMSGIFSECTSMKSYDIKFTINNCLNLSSMFYANEELEYLDLDNWVTNEVKDMSKMFKDC